MVSIADVGFGVSQTLPVLVALLAAKPGQLVYIEQPEIHLHPRAQRALARDITARTHGEAATARAIANSEARFSTDAVLDPDALQSLFESSGGFTFTAPSLAGGVSALLAEAGLFASKGEARRLIAAGGLTVNGERVTDPAIVPVPIAGEWLDVRIGKRRREVGRRAR